MSDLIQAAFRCRAKAAELTELARKEREPSARAELLSLSERYLDLGRWAERQDTFARLPGIRRSFLDEDDRIAGSAEDFAEARAVAKRPDDGAR